jgi:hypothetical protein
LEKLARKTNLQLEKNASEFQVHGMFVSRCNQDGPVARAVTRLLNKKYAGALRRFGREKNDLALRALWKEAREQGDIPGSYWALLSHPAASDELKGEAFGDVHMLSHLVGAVNRADIRRLGELERKFANSEAKRLRARAAYKRRIDELVSQQREMKDRLASMAKETEGYRSKSKVNASEALQKENAALMRSLGAQTLELMRVNALQDAQGRKLDAYKRSLDRTRSELAESQAELRFFNKELERRSQSIGVCPPDCGLLGTSECPGPDLCGKRILYVGGRPNLAPYYRELVERKGGEFLHHDGGLDDSRQSLPRVLGGVDAVICPVDCVSHDACLRVKQVCKHNGKPFRMIRSSSLSSLVRTLDDLCATSVN